MLNREARRVQLLKLPVYDQETDTFLNLPKDFSVDKHFKGSEQARKDAPSNQMK